jgi:outer membrane receptor protein involved in Fe transport
VNQAEGWSPVAPTLLALVALTLQTDPVHCQDAPAPATLPPASGATVSGVTVPSARPSGQTPIDRKSYSVGRDLSAQTGSVADVLRNIPSVQIDAQGNPSLQGEANVTVLIDGRPAAQFSGESLGDALQAMPASQIDRIEVMTNPPAEFRAEGTGGIINLVTRKASGAGLTGSARLIAETYDRATATASLGYNAGKLSVTGDVTYKHALRSVFDTLDLSQVDPATGLAVDSRDLSSKHATYDHWSADAGVDYDWDNRTRISGSAAYYTSRYRSLYADQFVQDDVSGDPISGLDRAGPERYSNSGADASLSWRQTYGEGHDLTLAADFSETELHDNRIDVLTPTSPLGPAPSSQQVIWTNRFERARFAADDERPLSGGQLKLGYDFEYAPSRIDQAGGSGAASGPITLDPSQRDVFLDGETDNEAYASYERRFGKVTVLAGLRAEDAQFALDQQTLGIHASHDYPRLFPNLHLAYDLGDGRQLTAGYSWRTNRPDDRQLDPFATSQTPLELQSGNPNLKPDDQSRYELGYQDQSGERSFTVTLYYHHRSDAFSQLYSNLPDGVLLQTWVNAGQSQTAGGEWTLSDRLTSHLRYSLSLDGYWIQLTTNPGLGVVPTRAAITGFGHADLTWQITPRDVLQVDLVTTAEGLQPQGYVAPTYSGNIGYRHTINRNLSWTLVAKDPFDTLRYRSVEDINGVENRRLETQSSQSVSLGLVWNLAGKPKDQGFDFEPDGGGAK